MAPRDIDSVDQELRLLAAVRQSTRQHGVRPSIAHIDELLDERLNAANSRRTVHD